MVSATNSSMKENSGILNKKVVVLFESTLDCYCLDRELYVAAGENTKGILFRSQSFPKKKGKRSVGRSIGQPSVNLFRQGQKKNETKTNKDQR